MPLGKIGKPITVKEKYNVVVEEANRDLIITKVDPKNREKIVIGEEPVHLAIAPKRKFDPSFVEYAQQGSVKVVGIVYTDGNIDGLFFNNKLVYPC
jgi:hypothetical protein